MKKLLLVSLCFLLLCASQVYAQNKTVTGTITSKDDGLPLPGVSVTVTGTSIGTQTNASGRYSLSVPVSAKSLTFSFIGFVKQQVAIGSSTSVSAALVSDQKALSEVLVVGYSTTTKQAFTGSAKSVSGAELDKKQVDNVSQALAGEVSGVRVINTSGQPGTEATIRIRGFGSVNGNRDPLYVVDGVPFQGSTNAIDVGDIESTTVLKDAVATAIYGSRGANGVILITTKNSKNKAGYIEAEVKYGSNVSLIPRYSVIKSPEQYVGLSWEGLYNQAIAGGANAAAAIATANTKLYGTGGISPNYNIWNVTTTPGSPSIGANLIDPATKTVKAGITRKYDPENWADQAFHHAANRDVNVRLGGSSDKSSYFMSLGYLNDVGYSIGSDFRRLSGRLNLTNNIKPWLNATMNLGYVYSNRNQGGQTQDSGSIFWFADNIPPIYGVYLRNPTTGAMVPDPIFGGNQYDYGVGRGFGALTNSIADTRYNTNRIDRNEFNGSASLNATIIPGLTFENTLGSQYYQNNNVQRNNKFYGSSAGQKGSIFLDRTGVNTYDLTDLLRYQKKIGDHNFQVLASHEITSYAQDELAAFKYNLVSNEGESLSNAVASTPSTEDKDRSTLDSYFAQLTYNYNAKYYFSGTIRRDGTSRFANNKWGTFGSVGAGWMISSEDFMKSQTIFKSLKLTASYGVIGDQSGVGYYGGSTYSNIGNDGNGGVTLGTPIVALSTLTWERANMSQVNIEFDLGNYLTGTVDYYLKNTLDLIAPLNVGPSLGYTGLTVNDGKLRNKGLEFDLTGHILKTKDFHLDLGVNGEFLKSQITANPIDPSTKQQKVINISSIYGRAPGHSLYDFYMKSYNGVNPANGNSVWNTYWVDLDGNGTPKTGTIEAGTGEYIASYAAFANYVSTHPNVTGINKAIQKTTTETYTNASLVYTGQSAIPTVRGAFNLNTGYKGVSLSVQVLYALGGYAYDYTYAGLMGDPTIGTQNFDTDILNRWQKAGDITNVPRLSNNQNLNVNAVSSRFITKSDYLALNNVQLRYDFMKSTISKLGLGGLSVWVSGDNLVMLSKRKGFNPSISENGESGQYQYAPLSTLSAGLNVKF